ncbi:MAG: MBL fold metallo-hydrolase [Candidatus Hydrogenedentota bacterium]
MTDIRRYIRNIAFFALLVLVAPLATAGELTVTFIGNMAFYISDGETTLLSDFPYLSGAYGYMEFEMEDVPEIKNGLSLITHFHSDHWHKKTFETMDVSIIAPTKITERLDKKRVIPWDEKKPMEYRGIQVEAISMPHNLAPQHFSYLVTWHGLRLYFPGDTETPADLLQCKDIDIMFISPWLIRTIERQNLVLDTKNLVMYHQKIGEEVVPFQNYKRMKQGATFTVEFEE